MYLLSVGLALFLGMHLVPVQPALKARLAAALGEKRYKGIFSVVSALGLVLVVIGYARAPGGPLLFHPYPVAVMLAPLVMTGSFILLAASHMKNHLRAWLGHPMLVGVGLWAAIHLLANGNARATLLFGAFLAYTVVDLTSSVHRRTAKPFKPLWRHDLIAVVAGVVIAVLVMTFHRPLFGVAVVPWGV